MVPAVANPDCQCLGNNSNVFSLGTFLALSNFESYSLVFVQSATTSAVDGAEVNEDVRAVFLLDKAEAFFIVEPFNGTGNEL